MSVFLNLVREPLVQFLAIGAAIFGIYSITSDNLEQQTTRIIVSDGRVEQLAQIFAKTWQRPPTRQEIRGLIDAYVKEEIFYREAVKLGLDRDDTLIRRRMQQKMEFLSEPSEEALKASDAELQAFIASNSAEFRVEPATAFQQVFINPDKSEVPAAERAETLLAQLSDAKAGADFTTLGDATLLPANVRMSSHSRIASNFGKDFADALAALPRNEWAGPVRSAFGLHLVRITEHRNAHAPKFENIRASAERKWRAQKRKEFQKSEYEMLRAKYTVVAPSLDNMGDQAKGSGR